MTKTTKFSKPPSLSEQEKEKKAEEFISFGGTSELKAKKDRPIEPAKKEPTKTVYLRVPQSYWQDIQEIISLTGLSMNAVCLELLRSAIKKKLKELRED